MLAVPGLIQAIAFSPDNQQFITSDTAGNIQAWDAVNATLIEDPAQKFPPASSLATSSQFTAFGAKDKINILGMDGNGDISPVEAAGENNIIVFNQDGSLLAAADSAGRINIWKHQNGAFVPVSSFIKERASSLAFNPEGTLLAVGTPKYVLLMDIASGQESARIPHKDTVNGVSFSSDGSYLATVSSRLLQFWETGKFRPIENDQLISAACSPAGMGKQFRGVYDLNANRMRVFHPGADRVIDDEIVEGLDDPRYVERFGDDFARARHEIELIQGASEPFDRDAFLAGRQRPVLFGSAINNFGVQEILQALVKWAPPPQPRDAGSRAVTPVEAPFSGFVFKIQANMDPRHRDRIAFLRVCSGRYSPGMKVWHVRAGREMRLGNALTFRRAETACAGTRPAYGLPPRALRKEWRLIPEAGGPGKANNPGTPRP